MAELFLAQYFKEMNNNCNINKRAFKSNMRLKRNTPETVVYQLIGEPKE